jgi:hypothetical protein
MQLLDGNMQFILTFFYTQFNVITFNGLHDVERNGQFLIILPVNDTQIPTTQKSLIYFWT